VANKSRVSKSKPTSKSKARGKARAKPAKAKPASRGKAAARKTAASKARTSAKSSSSVKMSKPPRQPGYIGGAAPMKAAPIKTKGTPAQLTLVSAAPVKRAAKGAANQPVTRAKGKPAASATAKPATAKPAAPSKTPSASRSVKPAKIGGATKRAPSNQTSLPLPEAGGVSPAHRSNVAQHVLQLYQETIDPDARLPAVLTVDPNDFDLDPGPFYEALEQLFKVEDTTHHAYAGYGGTIEQTIDFIASRWTGATPQQPDDVVDYE
jgi:hypothetical protein